MGDRYFLAELSWRLGPMVVGKAAAGLVSTQRAGAAVLPVWLWLRPKVDMGRKGQGLFVSTDVVYGIPSPPARG